MGNRALTPISARRIAQPAMIVDMPGRGLEEHREASIVLYYAFGVLVQYDALNRAVERFMDYGEYGKK